MPRLPWRGPRQLAYRRGYLSARDLDIQQDHVWLCLRGQRDGGGAVPGLADDVHIGLRLEDLAQSLTDQRVIVNEQDARPAIRSGHDDVQVVV